MKFFFITGHPTFSHLFTTFIGIILLTFELHPSGFKTSREGYGTGPGCGAKLGPLSGFPFGYRASQLRRPLTKSDGISTAGFPVASNASLSVSVVTRILDPGVRGFQAEEGTTRRRPPLMTTSPYDAVGSFTHATSASLGSDPSSSVEGSKYSPTLNTTVAGRFANAGVRSAVSARCGVANGINFEPSPDASSPLGETYSVVAAAGSE